MTKNDLVSRTDIWELVGHMAETVRPCELLNMKDKPVWFESKTGKPYSGWVLVYELHTASLMPGTRLGLTQPSGHIMWLILRNYDVNWRCWDSEPTDEERAALPWSTAYYRKDD